MGNKQMKIDDIKDDKSFIKYVNKKRGFFKKNLTREQIVQQYGGEEKFKKLLKEIILNSKCHN